MYDCGFEIFLDIGQFQFFGFYFFIKWIKEDKWKRYYCEKFGFDEVFVGVVGGYYGIGILVFISVWLVVMFMVSKEVRIIVFEG